MKFEVTNPKAWKAVNEKNIPMTHKIKVYEKLGGAYRLGEDGGEQVFNKMTELLRHKMSEGEESSPEQTLEGLKEMAMGNLERIADYANMILQRMSEGQELDSWMYSQLTIALENLNSVHDAMDGDDGKIEPMKEGDGLWANINAKQARGEKPAAKNSQAYKDAVKAGNKINKKENIQLNEDSETKRLEMLIKNLEETNKLLVQQLKDNKSLSNNKKENIKKSIHLNLDLINYYKKWLKDYQALANESLNEVKVIDIVDRFENLKLPNIVYLNKKPFTGKTFVMNGYNGYTSSDTDGLFYDIKTRKPLTDKQGNILRATTHRGAKFDFKDGIRESVNEEPAKTTGERIQNLNNRIKVLRDKISATKSPEQKKLHSDRLKNALQSLSNIRKDHSIK